jgi:RHS repeat-associated protein
MLLIIFLAALFALSPSNSFAQQTNSSAQGASQRPDGDPTPEFKPKQTKLDTQSAAIASGGDSAGGSIGGIRTPENTKVSSGGAATYSVPIVVPPGIVKPNLSFNYSSQGENSLLGVGWSVQGLPVIHRCPQTVAQDGQRSGVSYTSSDRFCLDGQRLMVISGVYGANDSEYRTEIDSFLKITAKTVAGITNGPGYFIVKTKDGQTMEFGGNTSSSQGRIEPQGRTDVVRVWALSKISDVKGNHLTVTYAEDDGTAPGQFNNGEYRPTQIDYSGNTNAGLGTTRKVTFEYATRSDQIPLWVGGSKILTTQLLTSVKTYAPAVGTTSPALLVRDYRLEYETGAATARSRLKNIKECDKNANCLPTGGPDSPTNVAYKFTYQTGGNRSLVLADPFDIDNGQIDQAKVWPGDYNGDGKQDLASYQNGVVYVHLSNANGTYTAVATTVVATEFGQNYVWPGDVNGDGRTDLVTYQGGTLYTYLAKSNGSGQFEQRVPLNVAGAKFNQDKTRGLDVDGDGRMDIVSHSNGKLWTYLSTFIGTTGNFNSNPPGVSANGSHFNSGYFWAGDFNGDGLQDLVAYDSGTLHAYLSNGAGTAWTIQSTSVGSGNFNPSKTWPGDYNADGMTDIASHENGVLHTYLSKGNGLFLDHQSTPSSQTWDPTGNAWAIDVNGDGRTDLISFQNTDFHVHYSKGNGTYDPVTTPTDGTNVNTSYLWVFDHNGDGKGDLATFSNGFLYTHTAHIASATDRFPDLLSSVVNPFNGTNTITYQPLTDGAPFYVKYNDAVYPKVDLQLPTYAVSNLTIGDGLGASYSNNYTYEGAKAHYLGRGGLGFRLMTHVEVDADVRSKTFYKQDFPHTGLVEIVEIDRVSDEAPFRETFTQYENQNGYTQSPTISFIGPKLVDIIEYEGSLSPSRTIRRQMFYDSAVNGNLIRTLHEGDISLTGNGDERDEQTDWIVVNNSTTYLHRPKRQVVFNGNSQGGAAIIREKWLYYDNQAYGSIGSFGLLTKEELNGGDPQGTGNNNPVSGKNPVTTYIQDSNFGVVTSVRDPRGCETVTAYDATKTFPQTITNCLNHAKTLSFDPGLGVKLSETDPNNATTSYEYDGFGRTKKVIGPLDSATYPTVSFDYVNWGTLDGSLNAQHVKTSRRVEHGQAETLDSWEYFDGLGRVDFTKQEGPDTTKSIVTDTVHNSRNLVVQRSAPYFVDASNTPLEPIKNVTFTYDVIGRLKRTTNADSTFSEIVYKVPGIVEITDERGKMRRKHFDAHGRLIKVEEFNSGQTYTTTYAYDGVGSLLTVVNHLGHTTRMAYDLLGRKEAMCDPNMGTAWGVTSCTTNSVGAWVYTYSSAGDLKTQKDAKNQTICFDYDLLGRPTVKKQGSTCTGPTLVAWTYDDPLVQNSKGRVTQVVDTATTTKFAYDIMGRTTETQRLVLGVWRTMAQTYNALNQVRTETFPAPDNEVVTYNYNTAGWLQSVTATSGPNYINDIQYNARGQKTQLTYGNNLTTNWTFDPNRFWVNGRTTSGNQQNLTYTRDPIGNILTITDGISSTGSRTFTYDDLNRLITGSGNFGPNQSPQSCTYEYNAIGDITNKCGTMFTYGDSMHPSAVTYNPATGKSYTYDANGNMLTRGNQTLNWDIDNRVTSISIAGGGTTSMEYDYTGMRFKKDAPTGITLFPFQGYEIAPNGEITKFIRIGVETFASKRGTSKLYYHNDHLGSVHVITNESAVQVQLNEYDPWGGVSKFVGDNAVDPTHRFNGKELDPETGLYYYGGRYYDPEISRFISPDPFIQAPDNPQSLNRYSYVLNNPQNYIDPSGYNWFTDLFKSIKKIFTKYIIPVSKIVVGAVMLASGNPAGAFMMLSGGLSFCKSSGCATAGGFADFMSGAWGDLQGGGSGTPSFALFATACDGEVCPGGGGESGSGWSPIPLLIRTARYVYDESSRLSSVKDDISKRKPPAQRVYFFGIGGAAYLSSAPKGTDRGVGGEVTIGLACENWSCIFYKSTGEVELNDPYGGKVTGGSIGVGPVFGYMEGGFNSFLGDSLQKSLTVGIPTYTTIESGSQIGASAGLSKGVGISGVIVRTKTSPLKWSDFKP